MIKIIPLIFLALLSGCVTRKACERKFPTMERDSVSTVSKTVTVIRDTTIYVRIPGDTVFASVPFDEESKLSTGMATSSARVKDGRLEHWLEQRDTAVAATLKEAIRTTNRDLTRKEVIYRTQYINRLSGWQWFQVWLGRILGGALVVLVVWRGIGRWRI